MMNVNTGGILGLAVKGITTPTSFTIYDEEVRKEIDACRRINRTRPTTTPCRNNGGTRR